MFLRKYKYSLFIILYLYLCCSLLVFSQSVPKDLYLENIRLQGVQAFSLKKIHRILQLKHGDIIIQEHAKQAADRLLSYYQEKHYYNAKVKWSVVPAEHSNWADFVLSVEEGSQGRVMNVRFEGNQRLTDQILKQIIEVRPRHSAWASWVGSDVFRPEELVEDYHSIRRAYFRRGYMDVDVGLPRVEYVEPNSLYITWPILKEGPSYRIERVVFTGDPVFSRHVMLSKTSLRPGALLSVELLQEAAQNIAQLYGNYGYPFTKVEPSYQLVTENGWSKVILNIDSGPQCLVDQINIMGNIQTRRAVIEQVIPIKPGTPYDRTQVALSKWRLEQLDIFEKVDVTVASTTDESSCVLAFDVEEKKTGRVQVGVTAGTVEGGAVVLVIDEKNLDYFPPFRGGGLTLSMSAQYGSEHRDFHLSFLNPRLCSSHYFLRENIRYRDIEYLDDYSQQTLGNVLGVGRAFGRYHNIFLAHEFRHLKVYDVKDASELIKDEEGTHRLGALSAQYTFDSRNASFRPSRGFHGRLKFLEGREYFGGNIEVYEVQAAASTFWSPGLDHVVNLRASFRSIEPYDDAERVPLSLRTFLGGPRDLRGFEYRSVSPRNANGTAIGGRTAYFATAEYTLPVPFIPRLDASLFYDIGNVAEEAFEQGELDPVSNVGVGFTVRAQNFPIRVNLAWPLEIRPDDTENKKGKTQVSFTAGYYF